MASLSTDVFSLEDFHYYQTIREVASAKNFGYFMGGNTPITVSTVDRINFASDTNTASIRGPLSFAKSVNAAVNGYHLPDKIDFSNDTMATSARRSGFMSTQAFAVGNRSYGYYNSSPGIGTNVDRIDYSNDLSTPLQRGSITTRATLAGATGNSNYGWVGGGLQSPTTRRSIVDRIDYSNDTAIASVRGPLPRAIYELAATGNSSYGWFGGGDDGAGTPSGNKSYVYRIDYSNDTATASQRTGIFGADALAATGNSDYGWFAGGVVSSYVSRIDFSNDLAAPTIRGPLSLARFNLGGTSAAENGGYDGAVLLAPNQPFEITSTSNYGYFGGGYTTVPVSSVDRIDYNNDTATASPRGPLSSARPGAFAGIGNRSYGYVGGGYSAPTPISSVDRIDYNNDTATASPRGPLSVARYGLAATGNNSYGWFGGGTPGSVIDRIDYSNDTATASPRGILTQIRVYIAATGNISYGWFGGGTPSNTRIDRIDYYNDSGTASPRGPLSLGRGQLAATGNISYGWFGAGYNAVPAAGYSSVDRVDYSNDTVITSPRGPLSQARYQVSATGNRFYGYFSGGTNTSPIAPVFSSTDRIDYSNDTATAVLKGPLSLARLTYGANSAAANAVSG